MSIIGNGDGALWEVGGGSSLGGNEGLRAEQSKRRNEVGVVSNRMLGHVRSWKNAMANDKLINITSITNC